MGARGGGVGVGGGGGGAVEKWELGGEGGEEGEDAFFSWRGACIKNAKSLALS